jgi:hypothetical protein
MSSAPKPPRQPTEHPAPGAPDGASITGRRRESTGIEQNSDAAGGGSRLETYEEAGGRSGESPDAPAPRDGAPGRGSATDEP